MDPYSTSKSGATTPGAESPALTTSGTSTPPHPPPVLGFDFPKPKDEINVREALERKPLRWTLQGQMEANKRRGSPALHEMQDKDHKTKQFEAVKQALLASHQSLQAKSTPKQK